jgi:hypothetical protein
MDKAPFVPPLRNITSSWVRVSGALPVLVTVIVPVFVVRSGVVVYNGEVGPENATAARVTVNAKGRLVVPPGVVTLTLSAPRLAVLAIVKVAVIVVAIHHDDVADGDVANGDAGAGSHGHGRPRSEVGSVSVT